MPQIPQEKGESIFTAGNIRAPVSPARFARPFRAPVSPARFARPIYFFVLLQTPSRLEPVLADKEVLLTALNIKAMNFTGLED